jgi:hypothetical protein
MDFTDDLWRSGVMGAFAGPDIVENGLVLALDAGNSKSYPGSGTTWTDLSGNGRTGTLTNMEVPGDYTSTNGGILTFDGMNEFVQCAGSSLVLTAATFIVWIKRGSSSGDSARAGLLISRTPTATGMNFYPFQISGAYPFFLAYHWNDTDTTYSWNSGLIVPLDSWSMCAITVTSSLATGYLYQASGLTTATNSTTHNSTTMSDIEVGRDALGRYFTGDIAQALIYNRALSAEEIQQNFNFSKPRFGL